jgi:hypothetical protein
LILAKKQGSDTSILSGIKATGFSNSEEAQTPYNDFVNILPFSLEDKIGELGGKYVKAGDWEEYVVWDGGVLTGEQAVLYANFRAKPGQCCSSWPQASRDPWRLIMLVTCRSMCVMMQQIINWLLPHPGRDLRMPIMPVEHPMMIHT